MQSKQAHILRARIRADIDDARLGRLEAHSEHAGAICFRPSRRGPRRRVWTVQTQAEATKLRPFSRNGEAYLGEGAKLLQRGIRQKFRPRLQRADRARRRCFHEDQALAIRRTRQSKQGGALRHGIRQVRQAQLLLVVDRISAARSLVGGDEAKPVRDRGLRPGPISIDNVGQNLRLAGADVDDGGVVERARRASKQRKHIPRLPGDTEGGVETSVALSHARRRFRRRDVSIVKSVVERVV